MGSPITFSGFNNIDFSAVLSAIMQQERAPIAAIEAQRTTLKAQDSAFSTLATRLAALKSAVADLADSDQLQRVSATSSDEASVGVSAGQASVAGRYEVQVQKLARAQVMVSETSYASVDSVVATSGAISLSKFGDPPIDVVLSGSMTLEDMADAINNAPGSPVSASVVQVSPGQYRLVLTGRTTGAANGFTFGITTPLNGGQGLAFVDTDDDGVSGDSEGDNRQQAIDAELTVNSVAVKSATNAVEGVIPGVTMTLRKENAAVTVDVAKNRDAAFNQLNSFASAYNDLIKFVKDQNDASANGRPAIGRDPLVRGLRDALRATILESEDGAGEFDRLAQIGIQFDAMGKMSINKNVLNAALDASPESVRQLFGGGDGKGGRFGELNNLISGYTEAGGLVSDMRHRIDDQVARLGSRIDTLESQLAVRRAALQQEFIAADRAMSQLKNQGSSLTQLSGQFRLF